MRNLAVASAVLLALCLLPSRVSWAAGETMPDLSEICAHVNCAELGSKAAGETLVDLAEICAKVKCREPGKFKLRTEQGEKELEQPGLPYVYEGSVIILPGDEFDIEIEFSGDGKAGIALAGDTPRPDHTIHIEFSQMDGKEDMMLSLRNKTGATVKYGAYMVLPDGRKGYTSSCPLRPGLAAFEHWPHPIMQLLLTDFRKLDESAGMACE